MRESPRIKRMELRIQSNPTLRLVSISALMTIVSGGLLVAATLLHRASMLAISALPMEVPVAIGLYGFVGILFFVPIGMVGFHILQVGNYGRMGRVSFWTVVMGSIVLGLVLGLGLAGYLRPWENSMLLWLVTRVSALGLVVGFILYGVATLQARVLPRWCALAFIIGLPGAIALMWIRPLFGLGQGASATSIVFGLVWLALGYMLWTRRREAGEYPFRVR